MTKVYIAQLKCPSNHCVVGLAGVYDGPEEAQVLAEFLMQAFDFAVTSGMLKRECGICKSTDLNPDVAATVFRTMEEAKPALAEMEAAQAQSAGMLRDSRN